MSKRKDPAKIKAKELRAMSREERQKLLQELRAELMRLQTLLTTRGRIENPARIRLLKRAIARILTVEREEELKKLQSESKAK
ncbi:MAG: 50S ribosomal protein L29 [Thermoprotei archaeon]|nr:MAG: 50S ribosomal protein L29 [Thermoprotei archaeon]